MLHPWTSSCFRSETQSGRAEVVSTGKILGLEMPESCERFINSVLACQESFDRVSKLIILKRKTGNGLHNKFEHRRHNTCHNDTQHNDIQHNNRQNTTLSLMVERCYNECL